MVEQTSLQLVELNVDPPKYNSAIFLYVAEHKTFSLFFRHKSIRTAAFKLIIVMCVYICAFWSKLPE